MSMFSSILDKNPEDGLSLGNKDVSRLSSCFDTLATPNFRQHLTPKFSQKRRGKHEKYILDKNIMFVD
jgi:hypothetical protein